MKDNEFGYEICSHCRKIFKKEHGDNRFCSIECNDQFKSIKAENIKHIDKAKFIIFERDEFKCIYCGKSSIEHGIVLCIDHIYPYYHKMNNNIYNLITSCWDCNTTKGAKRLDWQVYHRILDENKKRTNNKISEDSRYFVSKVMDLYFYKQKGLKYIKEYLPKHIIDYL